MIYGDPVTFVAGGGGDTPPYNIEEYESATIDGTKRIVLPLKWGTYWGDLEVFVDFTLPDTSKNDMALFGNNGAPGWSYSHVVAWQSYWTNLEGNLHALETGRHTIRLTPTEGYYDGVYAGANRWETSANDDLVLFGRTGATKTTWTAYNFTGSLHRFSVKDTNTGKYVLDIVPAKLMYSGAVIATGLRDRVNGFFYDGITVA